MLKVKNNNQTQQTFVGLEDVLKTSSRHVLEDVFQHVFKHVFSVAVLKDEKISLLKTS